MRESPTQLDAYPTVQIGLRAVSEEAHQTHLFTIARLAQISFYAHFRRLWTNNAYLSIGPHRIPSLLKAFPAKFNPMWVLENPLSAACDQLIGFAHGLNAHG